MPLTRPSDGCEACPSCQAKNRDRWAVKVGQFREKLKEQDEGEPRKVDSWPHAIDLKITCELQVGRLVPEIEAEDGEWLWVGWQGTKGFSSTPAEDLRRTELRGLKIKKRHTGKYIILRVISKPSMVDGIYFAAQDPNGDSCVVGIFNAPSLMATHSELEYIYPTSSVFLIREPYLKTAEGGQPMIRIDSPTDFVFLHEQTNLKGLTWSRPFLPVFSEPSERSQPSLEVNTDACKMLGDKLLKDGYFLAAERAYTIGLSLDPRPVALRLNRAFVRLKAGHYRGALQDARFILSLDRTSYPSAQLEKAFYRAASAEYALQLWAFAESSFKELVSAFPTSKEGKEGLVKVSKRRHEAATGVYDWLNLYKASLENPNVDLADYISPNLVITETSDMGRQYTAKRAIKRGELLLMVKPFAVVTKADVKKKSQRLVYANLHNDSHEWPTKALLTHKITRRLLDDPSTLDAFNLLDHGEHPHPPNFSLARLKPKPTVDPALKTVSIDTSRIERVCVANAVAVKPLADAVPSRDLSIVDDETKYLSGLYLAPSLFNHSCTPTCRQDFLGDAQFVRAIEDIPEGDELSISYTPNDMHLDRREYELHKRKVWACNCVRCLDDLAASDLQRLDRMHLVNRIYTLSVPADFDAPSADKWLAYECYEDAATWVTEAEAMFAPEHPVSCRPELWHAYNYLAMVASFISRRTPSVSERTKYRRLALTWGEQAILSCGFEPSTTDPATFGWPLPAVHATTMHSQVIETCLIIIDILMLQKKPLLVGIYQNLVEVIHESCVGPGLELLTTRYSAVMQLHLSTKAQFIAGSHSRT